jgi:STE24 endopeptidase
LGQAIYLLVFIVLIGIILLPINFYQGYAVEHSFDLSTQTAAGWLGDEIKSTVLAIVLFVPAGLAAYYLLTVAGPYWWVYGALLWTAFNFGLAYLAPVVIMPLFNKFEPLESEDLSRDILDLAGRAGVGISEVLMTDMSRRTKKANAFFTGVGNTRRIVLGDTLLENYDHDEILTVVGHEMGHWKLGHLTKNTAIGIISAFVGFYAADRILTASLGPLALTSISDIAGLPLIILTFIVLGFIGMPLLNSLSRYFERQADTFELRLVGKPAATISTFEKLAEQNLADPDPNPVIEFILFSHPSVRSRIAEARGYL